MEMIEVLLLMSVAAALLLVGIGGAEAGVEV